MLSRDIPSFLELQTSMERGVDGHQVDGLGLGHRVEVIAQGVDETRSRSLPRVLAAVLSLSFNEWSC